MAHSNYALDTTAYPVFATKKALLRGIMQARDSKTNLLSLAYRINNTDLNGLADKSTIFLPANNFAVSS